LICTPPESFQKILDHPGVILEDPVGALTRLQLARALAMSGDVPKAKTAYQDLLALWKDADPNPPLPKETRSEYVKLPRQGELGHSQRAVPADGRSISQTSPLKSPSTRMI
jgi:hypothetical protein